MNAVSGVAADNESAFSVDGQIILCIQGRCDGVIPILNRGLIAQCIHGAFGQRYNQFIGKLLIDRRTFCAFNGDAIQDQVHLFSLSHFDDHLSLKTAGEYVLAFAGDLHGVSADFHTRCIRGGCAALKGNDGSICAPGIVHIFVFIQCRYIQRLLSCGREHCHAEAQGQGKNQTDQLFHTR